MLGAGPAGDTALGSKGTLFILHPGCRRCWAGSGPPRGPHVVAWTQKLTGSQAIQLLTQMTLLLLKA